MRGAVREVPDDGRKHAKNICRRLCCFTTSFGAPVEVEGELNSAAEVVGCILGAMDISMLIVSRSASDLD